jgi:hypothetical protein
MTKITTPLKFLFNGLKTLPGKNVSKHVSKNIDTALVDFDQKQCFWENWKNRAKPTVF